METQKSPTGSVRRHARNISHPIRQSATTGPLEETEDNPLAQTPTSPSGASVSEISQSIPSLETRQIAGHEPDVPNALTIASRSPISLAFLQDPKIYHQLTTDDVAKPFFDSETQPSPDTSLHVLLDGGHFRRAAEQALTDLLASQSDIAEQVLQLLYIRLACLVLISRPDIAVQEAVPLTDHLARSAPGADDIVPLIPWDLRLLLVRLQAIGASDGGRRGIMALYALSGEVRANLQSARNKNDVSTISVWSDRLQDLGLRVCDALVEMDELNTASRHLETLQDTNADEIVYRQALLRVRVGDIQGAQRYADQLKDDTRKKGVKALLKTAYGDYNADIWESLMTEYPSHELFAQNAAVSLLYTGHIASAREMLEDLSSRLPLFPTLLFNLSTIYELCTERSAENKNNLAQRASAKAPLPDSGGWERAAYEFKL